jgi:hypothetical protein
MKDGSGRWLPSRWEDLLRTALVALDSLEGGAGPWTFGGGTALAQILGHRISYDVDIFLDSSTALKQLAPNVNPVTKSLCDTWQWPGRYLKLILRDVGEIDFLNAPSYIDNPTYELKFGERAIAAERSAEIATKKLVELHGTRRLRSRRDLSARSFSVGRDRAVSGHHSARRVVCVEPVEPREEPVSSGDEKPDQRDFAGGGVHRQSLRHCAGGARGDSRFNS